MAWVREAADFMAEMRKGAVNRLTAALLSGGSGQAGPHLPVSSPSMAESPGAIASLQPRLQQAAALFRQGQLADARARCEEILRVQPKIYAALNLLGLIALREQDAKQALVLFGKAITLEPATSTAHGNRGVALLELGDLAGALESLDVAIRLAPDDAQAHLQRGNVLKLQWRLEEALTSYHRASALRPDFVEAWTNCGVVQVQLARYVEARWSFDRALTLRPDHASAHWNRGLLSLLLGDFETGWADYEWRWHIGLSSEARRHYTERLWMGKEPLAGRRILLYAEQGLGDTIQFCRYVERVAALGADIVLEVQPSLARLLRSLAGVSALISGEPRPPFDYQCALMSLPGLLGTRLDSIWAPSPYLRSDPERRAFWQRRLGERRRPRIGLAWRGRPTHWNDRNRSISLADWLAQLPSGFDYVSLQKELAEPDRKLLKANPQVLSVARELADFAETAALIECLDLVVTVDSSVAHLAGALGKPTWVLLPFNPDWRWLLGRADSPWYPTLELYRQATMGAWAPVLERVRTDLLARFR